MNGDRERVRHILSKAAREFERNGKSRRAIRLCEEEFPELFLDEGLYVLTEANESAGYRFLAILLVNAPSIFDKLTNRWHLTRDQAIKAARRLFRVDVNFDCKLTALLPGRDNSVRPFSLEGEHVERALEILDAISPGRRIVSSIRHLTGHPDSKVSAKAALVIGKRIQNPVWARRVIAESDDARLRANAIETLWGLNTTEVVDLFMECLGDWENRVVGNAIVGLYKAGHPNTFELVANIAAEPNPKHRMTAAWAMGQIGDPQFVSILLTLVRDVQSDVRRAALRSLRNFHIQEKRSRAAAVLGLA